MTTNAEMLQRCRAFAEELIPELRGAVFYVLDSDDLHNDPRFTHDALAGWAVQAPNVSELLPNYLGDNWQGPGPAVFLNLRWLRLHAYPGYFEQAVLTVFTHELGHVEFPLWMPRDHSPRVAQALGQLQLAALTHSVSLANVPTPAADTAHDWKWIRRTIHLYVRAAANGHVFGIDRLLHSGDCQFDARKYVPILLTEALRMKDEPMAAVNDLPADAWLVDTYNFDVETFMDEINSDESE